MSRVVNFVAALLVFVASVGTVSSTDAVDFTTDPPQYGVDCSYPIHYGIDPKKCPAFHDAYERMIEGCYKLYNKRDCQRNEQDRLRMNLEQPPTQHNYTRIGFKKMRIPKAAWEPLITFYNKWKDQKKKEEWYHGSTIVNSWDSPSYMVSFEDRRFPEGIRVKEQIWEGMRPVIEEWVGHKLEPTSLYGVRIYSSGSILATRTLCFSFFLNLRAQIIMHISAQMSIDFR